MGKIESGYAINKNDQGIVIRTFGIIPPRKIIRDLERMNSDPDFQSLPLQDLRSSIINACTRLGVILCSGGIISSDGRLAMPLSNDSKTWPSFSQNHVRITPDFTAKLGVEHRGNEARPNPFFFLRGENGKKLLILREVNAMINLVNASYQQYGNPYPRVSSRSIVEQVLLSSLSTRPHDRIK